MNTMFEDLMAGLDELESYLVAEREGYKVHVPAVTDIVEALLPGSVEE